MGAKTFDALIFGYYDSGRLVYAARTRNGFIEPKYHFRKALKYLDHRAGRFKASWTLLGFNHKEIGLTTCQSITAHELACEAALAVLEQHFPDEEFFVNTHMTNAR